MSFTGRDIITTEDLSKEDILKIMETSGRMEKMVEKEKIGKIMEDRIVAVIFLEPSTRTRLSFVTAVHRVGAKPIVVADAKSSSQSKGESLEDTARTIEGYADCIVVRQPVIGGARRMADAAAVPVINGGDGAGQHPTQALLDLYTIIKEKGSLEGLKVAMVGDLKFGRTVHSLSYALAPFNPEYIYCSPGALKMPESITADMKARNIPVYETENIKEAVQADIVYMTRVQRERFDDPAEYDRLKGSYILSRKLVEEGQKDLIVLHPLPRVDEISTDVDDLPNAAYFRQAHNGVYLRMALLALVTGAAE